MFFVVGSARSGTTLLRVILNAHPQIAVPPESRFVVEMWEGETEVDAASFLEKLTRHPRFQLWELPIEDVRAEIGDKRRVPYSTAIEAAFVCYARARGKNRWGDKTPRYIEQIPLLSRLFPDAKFVHQIRDGRNVALSYADVPFGPKTVGKAAALWRERVSAGITEGRRLGDDRYLELRYEDFVADAESHTKILCDFLGVGYDERMLDYAEQSRTDILPRASRYNPNLTRAPSEGVRSWQNQMRASDVELFEAIAGELLDQLDYPRRYQNRSPVVRVRAALSRVGLAGRLRQGRTSV